MAGLANGISGLVSDSNINQFFVMAGQKREARLRADVPAIHVFNR
jgi:hypothetical protein